MKKIYVLLFLMMVGCTATGHVAPIDKSFYQAHTKVQLVSPVKNFWPGDTVWIGLRMTMDDQWHVYWKNPGDSGLPPTMKWELPQGLSAGDIQWPYPKLIELPPLASYGYENDVTLFSPIRIPADFNAEQVLIKARVDWLACKVECIPGRAELEIVLPKASGKSSVVSDPLGEKLFQDMKKRWPVLANGVEVQAYEQQGEIFFEIGPVPIVKPHSQIYFYPERSDSIDHAAGQVLSEDEGLYRLTVKKSSLQNKTLKTISGILVNQLGWEAVDYPQAISVDSSVVVIEPPVVDMAAQISPVIPRHEKALTLVVACIFAVLGGLILNLMPCVLPVLSLKVLHLVEHSRSRKKALINGLVYCAGIIISFWILASILILLRSFGAAIGWGFQFQSPAFVVVIAGILFIFALNLFGLFEIGVNVTSLGNTTVGKNGLAASFASGVLATIVATPCTAPFMGTALSFALSRSPWEAVLVFTCLGIGMGLPIVILSANPKLLKMIPKSGPWMNTLKNILGFLLLASVIWLIWVFGLQKGIHAVAMLLVSFLFLSVGLYFYGHVQSSTKKSLLNICSAIFFIIAGCVLAGFIIRQPESFSIVAEEKLEANHAIVWQSFTPELLARLKQGEQPVFLDFTAAWCLSCQVNERVALSDEKVIKAFRQYDIMALKADWTNKDPAIAAALAEYGRSSIPLYVLYPGGGREPVFLPEIITPGIVLDYLTIHLKE